MIPERLRLGTLALGLALAAGCATQRPVEPAVPAPDGVPEPRSRYGNGPIYEVHGRRYVVLETARGYRERGIASWYGEKFHGRPTSSREPYDMYAMTAAHRTLPLPSWVRVTNLANGKSVVVRINDRGPFVANRIIDLSYAAALTLDMVKNGTARVEVAALDAAPLPDTIVASTVNDPVDSPIAATQLYVQVGAFGDLENARRRFEELQTGGIVTAFVHEDTAARPALYRVRIGPIADAAQYDALVMKLRDLGISEMHLVAE